MLAVGGGGGKLESTGLVNSAARKSNTVRMRRLACSSRWAARYIGKRIESARGSTRRTSGSASPTASVIMPIPAPRFTYSHCTRWFSEMIGKCAGVRSKPMGRSAWAIASRVAKPRKRPRAISAGVRGSPMERRYAAVA